jgi:hypothetical protein
MVRFRVADRLDRDRMKTKIDGEVSAFRSGDPPPGPAYSAGVPNCQADESASVEINAAFPPDCVGDSRVTPDLATAALRVPLSPQETPRRTPPLMRRT